MHINGVVRYVTIRGQAYGIPFYTVLLTHKHHMTPSLYGLGSPFWKNKSAGVMRRLLILTNAITYIINVFIFTLEAVYLQDFKPDINQ